MSCGIHRGAGEILTFRPCYLGVATGIFGVEVAIATGYIPGVFVRNSLGDALATALMYCVVRGISRATSLMAWVISVSAGITTEFLQYLHMTEVLGLHHGSILSIVFGATFRRFDVVMYGVGGCVVAWLDVRCFRARRAFPQRADRTRPPGGK